MRIVLIGAGSHVFGLSMLSQFLVENSFEDIHLALVEVDEESGRRMAAVANRLRANSATWHADWDLALEGADFVICSAAVQLRSRFERDREIIRRLAPDHLLTEFGGIYGAGSTLRQFALIEGLCASMRRLCPGAKLFVISNPMPRLVHAASLWGIDAVGFCSVSEVGHNLVARLLGEPEEPYPFDRIKSKVYLRMGGTNHLSWLSIARDRETGEDLLPKLRQAWETEGANSKSLAVANEVGALPLSGDDHIQDFLPPLGMEPGLQHISHGSEAERQSLSELLDRFADGQANWEEIQFSPSWERPGDVVRALRGGPPTLISSLNLPNRGQLPDLGTGAIVESPVYVDAAGFFPIPVPLAPGAARWSRRCIAVTEALFAAYDSRSIVKMRRALELDPTVLDLTSASAALGEIIASDVDLIGPFD